MGMDGQNLESKGQRWEVNSGQNTSVKRGSKAGDKGYPKWVQGYKQKQGDK